MPRYGLFLAVTTFLSMILRFPSSQQSCDFSISETASNNQQRLLSVIGYGDRSTGSAETCRLKSIAVKLFIYHS